MEAQEGIMERIGHKEIIWLRHGKMTDTALEAQ